jgi:multiple sugar transport system permease protein
MSRDDLFDPTVIAIPRDPNFAGYRTAAYLMDYWPSVPPNVGETFSSYRDAGTGVIGSIQGVWNSVIGSMGTLINSIWITFLVAALQIAACTLVAYGFARFEFPLKRFWFACVILTVIIPPQVIRAPLFLNFQFFDLFGLVSLINGQPIQLTNLTGYALLSVTAMGLRNGLYIFMLRQYFRNMPKELEESAWVDGCGKLKTFVKIMLPDAVPMIVSCFLFAFVWQWTDGFYTNIFLRDYGIMAVEMSSLGDVFNSYYIRMVTAAIGGHGVAPPVAMIEAMISTGVLIGIAPVIVLYLFFLCLFVESIGQSGIKM